LKITLVLDVRSHPLRYLLYAALVQSDNIAAALACTSAQR
jgi:hypothetical protein